MYYPTKLLQPETEKLETEPNGPKLSLFNKVYYAQFSCQNDSFILKNTSLFPGFHFSTLFFAKNYGQINKYSRITWLKEIQSVFSMIQRTGEVIIHVYANVQ